jgi:hypothetical protein
MTATTDAPAMNHLIATLATDLGIVFDNIRTRGGKGLQVVDIHRHGEFVRRLTYLGTADQAYAKALLGYTHDTKPEWAALVAILRGE